MHKVQKTNPYDSMLNLPRPISGRRARMSMIDRGAQFSPFAALTGYDGVIQETARLTEDAATLAEGGEAMLDEALREIDRRIEERPEVLLVCFQEDSRKSGGSYREITGSVKKIDLYARKLVLTDGQEVPIQNLYHIEIQE